MSAETSYSRYQNYKSGVSGYTLDLANTSGTGDRVMNIKGNVTISNDILGNGNYSSLISATLKYDGLSMLTSPAVTSNVFTPNTLENNTGLLSGSDVISQGWGQHTVAASFTFDGVKASNGTQSLACHVTGIPYSVDFGNSQDWKGWTPNNAVWARDVWGSGTYKLTLNNSFIVSPEYHIPSDIAVSVPSEIQYYVGFGSKKTTFSVGATKATNVKSTNPHDITQESDIWNQNKSHSATFETVLTPDLRYISITAGAEKTHVYSLNIKYR